MWSDVSTAWWFHASTAYKTDEPADARTDGGSTHLVSLPSPVIKRSFEQLLARRVSCRRFSTRPLSLADLVGMLHAGYGVLGDALAGQTTFKHRPVPSAGARYPLSLYVLARSLDGADRGVYRYEAERCELVAVGSRPDDGAIAEIFIDQPYVASASAILMITAQLALTLERYGARGYRYVLFEAGHVSQNIALCAAASGIGNLEIGGFLDDRISGLLGLSHSEVPLYGAAVGYPESSDPAVTRSIQ
jgi:SagB-type dehydrogenase family enzyme